MASEDHVEWRNICERRGNKRFFFSCASFSLFIETGNAAELLTYDDNGCTKEHVR